MATRYTEAKKRLVWEYKEEFDKIYRGVVQEQPPIVGETSVQYHNRMSRLRSSAVSILVRNNQARYRELVAQAATEGYLSR